MNPPLKWHGGKHYLANKLIELFPPHIHYVEPYFGGGSVLLAKPFENVSEVVNDINYNLTNFWRVLQDTTDFEKFKRTIEATPFSQWEYEAAAEGRSLDESVSRAVNFFICCRQSMAGRMKTFAPLTKRRTRRGMNEQASAWITSIEGLEEVHKRLQRVVIFCADALDVIRKEDSEHTFFYLDPPYLQDTRTAPSVYAHEMSEAQHKALLEVLLTIKGKFMLSGYTSPLYHEYQTKGDWFHKAFDLPNNAASGDSKRRMYEYIWMNY